MNTTLDANVGPPSQILLGWLDITLFGMMLGVSTLIGIYFGFCGKKEDTPKEYLHGGKTMSTLPVAVSLVSSIVSGITIMGVPSEIYTHGTLYWLVCIDAVTVALINNYIYLPVFYDLQLTSTYEYLEIRFNKSVRIMASVLYTLSMILYIPIVIYVPALALSQVTDLNIHYITVGISVICIFYTMVGGLKAVVWTDFLQGLVMVGACIVVLILGIIQIGNISSVWEINDQGGRIRFFEMSLTPFARMTFWSVTIGHTFSWLSAVAVNQGMVQKFMSLPTYKKAQQSLVFSAVGLIIIKSICCFTGLLIYAKFRDCDPLSTQVIKRPDQLLPYYVMEVSATIPGLPGLFMAGIFSAALSSMSSVLNSLGATLFEDFVRPFFKNKISDKTANNIIKFVVVIIGAICVLIVFVVDKLGSILQLSMSAVGVTAGAGLGLFTFGMFYPRGNSKGALIGSITSMVIMVWIVFGNQKALAEGSIKQNALPISVEGCDFNVTLVEKSKEDNVDEEALFIFRISFLYYTLMGLIIMLLVATVVSHFTEPPDLEKMNHAVFTPFVRKYLLKRKNRANNNEPAQMELLNTASPD